MLRFTNPPRPAPHERGVALVTTTLLLLLIAVLVAAFLIIVSGERAMSSNVHTAREAMYSADAGIRVAQQNLANIARPRLDSLIAVYPGSGPIIPLPSSFFPKGGIPSTSTSPKFNAITTVEFFDSLLSVQSQVYNYRYTVSSTGNFGGTGTRSIQSQGVLRLSTGRGSFADYLMFTDQHTLPSGGSIWFTSSGNFDGRIHTNTQFRIQGTPTFGDLITSVNSKAWYYNNGNPTELNADNNKTIDVPRLFGGFKRGQPTVALPSNSYSQQRAALGLDPSDMTQASNATIRGQLGLSGTLAPPDGIYVPNSLGGVTGGIYVQGTLDRYVMSIDGAGRQVYELTQDGVIKTITVDRTVGTTTVETGATTDVYTGVPRGILYTNGGIDDMGGPDRVGATIPPALADGTELLVTATGDIVLQNDITCDDYYAAKSVLGIFSSDGKIRMGSSAPNNMELHAYLMATGSSGCVTVDNYSTTGIRGTFHLNGGLVSKYYGAFGTFGSNGKINHGYARDFKYDGRGLVPPYFPMSSQVVANVPKAHTLVWKEQ